MIVTIVKLIKYTYFLNPPCNKNATVLELFLSFQSVTELLLVNCQLNPHLLYSIVFIAIYKVFKAHHWYQSCKHIKTCLINFFKLFFFACGTFILKIYSFLNKFFFKKQIIIEEKE